MVLPSLIQYSKPTIIWSASWGFSPSGIGCQKSTIRSNSSSWFTVYRNCEYLPILALIAKSDTGLYLMVNFGLIRSLSYPLNLEILTPEIVPKSGFGLHNQLRLINILFKKKIKNDFLY